MSDAMSRIVKSLTSIGAKLDETVSEITQPVTHTVNEVVNYEVNVTADTSDAQNKINLLSQTMSNLDRNGRNITPLDIYNTFGVETINSNTDDPVVNSKQWNDMYDSLAMISKAINLNPKSIGLFTANTQELFKNLKIVVGSLDNESRLSTFKLARQLDSLKQNHLLTDEEYKKLYADADSQVGGYNFTGRQMLSVLMPKIMKNFTDILFHEYGHAIFSKLLEKYSPKFDKSNDLSNISINDFTKKLMDGISNVDIMNGKVKLNEFENFINLFKIIDKKLQFDRDKEGVGDYEKDINEIFARTFAGYISAFANKTLDKRNVRISGWSTTNAATVDDELFKAFTKFFDIDRTSNNNLISSIANKNISIDDIINVSTNINKNKLTSSDIVNKLLNIVMVYDKNGLPNFKHAKIAEVEISNLLKTIDISKYKFSTEQLAALYGTFIRFKVDNNNNNIMKTLDKNFDKKIDIYNFLKTIEDTKATNKQDALAIHKYGIAVDEIMNSLKNVSKRDLTVEELNTINYAIEFLKPRLSGDDFKKFDNIKSIKDLKDLQTSISAELSKRVSSEKDSAIAEKPVTDFASAFKSLAEDFKTAFASAIMHTANEFRLVFTSAISTFKGIGGISGKTIGQSSILNDSVSGNLVFSGRDIPGVTKKGSDKGYEIPIDTLVPDFVKLYGKRANLFFQQTDDWNKKLDSSFKITDDAFDDLVKDLNKTIADGSKPSIKYKFDTIDYKKIITDANDIKTLEHDIDDIISNVGTINQKTGQLFTNKQLQDEIDKVIKNLIKSNPDYVTNLGNAISANSNFDKQRQLYVDFDIPGSDPLQVKAAEDAKMELERLTRVKTAINKSNTYGDVMKFLRKEYKDDEIRKHVINSVNDYIKFMFNNDTNPNVSSMEYQNQQYEIKATNLMNRLRFTQSPIATEPAGWLNGTYRIGDEIRSRNDLANSQEIKDLLKRMNDLVTEIGKSNNPNADGKARNPLDTKKLFEDLLSLEKQLKNNITQQIANERQQYDVQRREQREYDKTGKGIDKYIERVTNYGEREISIGNEKVLMKNLGNSTLVADALKELNNLKLDWQNISKQDNRTKLSDIQNFNNPYNISNVNMDMTYGEYLKQAAKEISDSLKNNLRIEQLYQADVAKASSMYENVIQDGEKYITVGGQRIQAKDIKDSNGNTFFDNYSRIMKDFVEDLKNLSSKDIDGRNKIFNNMEKVSNSYNEMYRNSIQRYKDVADIKKSGLSDATSFRKTLNSMKNTPTINSILGKKGLNDPKYQINSKLKLTDKELSAINTYEKLLNKYEEQLEHVPEWDKSSANKLKDKIDVLMNKFDTTLGKQLEERAKEQAESVFETRQHLSGVDKFQRTFNSYWIDTNMINPEEYVNKSNWGKTTDWIKAVRTPDVSQNVNRLYSEFTRMFSSATSIFTSAFGKIKGIFSTVYNYIKSAVNAIVGLVTTAIKALYNVLSSIASFVMDKLTTGFKVLLGTLGAVGASVVGFGATITMLGKSILSATDEYKKQTIQLLGIYKTPERTTNMVNMVYDVTRDLPVNYTDAMKTLGEMSAIPAIQSEFKSPDTANQRIIMDKMFKVITAMTTMRPDQSSADAMFSLRNAFAGDLRSLQRRFDLPTKAIYNSRGTMGLTAVKDSPMEMLKSLENYFDTFLDVETLKEASLTITGILDKIKGAFDLFKSNIGGFGFYDTIKNDLKKVRDVIIGFVNSTDGSKIAKTFSDVLSSIYKSSRNIIINIKNGLADAFGIDTGNIMNFVAGLSKTVAKVFKVVENFINADKISDTIKSIGNWIEGIIPVIDKVAGHAYVYFNDAVDMIKKLFNQFDGIDGIFNFDMNWFDRISNSFKTIINNIKTGLSEAFDSFIQNNPDSIISKTLTSISDFINSISGNNIFETISNTISNIISKFETLANSFNSIDISKIATAFLNIVASIENKIKELYPSVKSLFISIVNDATYAINTIISLFKTVKTTLDSFGIDGKKGLIYMWLFGPGNIISLITSSVGIVAASVGVLVGVFGNLAKSIALFGDAATVSAIKSTLTMFKTGLLAVAKVGFGVIGTITAIHDLFVNLKSKMDVLKYIANEEITDFKVSSINASLSNEYHKNSDNIPEAIRRNIYNDDLLKSYNNLFKEMGGGLEYKKLNTKDRYGHIMYEIIPYYELNGEQVNLPSNVTKRDKKTGLNTYRIDYGTYLSETYKLLKEQNRLNSAYYDKAIKGFNEDSWNQKIIESIGKFSGFIDDNNNDNNSENEEIKKINETIKSFVDSFSKFNKSENDMNGSINEQTFAVTQLSTDISTMASQLAQDTEKYKGYCGRLTADTLHAVERVYQKEGYDLNFGIKSDDAWKLNEQFKNNKLFDKIIPYNFEKDNTIDKIIKSYYNSLKEGDIVLFGKNTTGKNVEGQKTDYHKYGHSMVVSKNNKGDLIDANTGKLIDYEYFNYFAKNYGLGDRKNGNFWMETYRPKASEINKLGITLTGLKNIGYKLYDEIKSAQIESTNPNPSITNYASLYSELYGQLDNFTRLYERQFGVDDIASKAFKAKNNDTGSTLGPEAIRKLQKEYNNAIVSMVQKDYEIAKAASEGKVYNPETVKQARMYLEESLKNLNETIPMVISDSIDALETTIATVDYKYAFNDVEKYIKAKNKKFENKLMEEAISISELKYSSYFAQNDDANKIIQTLIGKAHGNINNAVSMFSEEKQKAMNLKPYVDTGVFATNIPFVGNSIQTGLTSHMNGYIYAEKILNEYKKLQEKWQPINAERNRREVVTNNIGNMTLSDINNNWVDLLNDSSKQVRQVAISKYKSIIEEGIEVDTIKNKILKIRDITVESLNDIEDNIVDSIKNIINGTYNTFKSGFDKLLGPKSERIKSRTKIESTPTYTVDSTGKLVAIKNNNEEERYKTDYYGINDIGDEIVKTLRKEIFGIFTAEASKRLTTQIYGDKNNSGLVGSLFNLFGVDLNGLKEQNKELTPVDRINTDTNVIKDHIVNIDNKLTTDVLTASHHPKPYGIQRNDFQNPDITSSVNIGDASTNISAPTINNIIAGGSVPNTGNTFANTVSSIGSVLSGFSGGSSVGNNAVGNLLNLGIGSFANSIGSNNMNIATNAMSSALGFGGGTTGIFTSGGNSSMTFGGKKSTGNALAGIMALVSGGTSGTSLALNSISLLGSLTSKNAGKGMNSSLTKLFGDIAVGGKGGSGLLGGLSRYLGGAVTENTSALGVVAGSISKALFGGSGANVASFFSGAAVPVIGAAVSLLSQDGWGWGARKDKYSNAKASAQNFNSMKTAMIDNREKMSQSYYMADAGIRNQIENFQFGNINYREWKSGHWYNGTKSRKGATDATDFVNTLEDYWDLILEAAESQYDTQRKLTQLQKTNYMEYLQETNKYENMKLDYRLEELNKWKGEADKWKGERGNVDSFTVTVFTGESMTIAELNNKVMELTDSYIQQKDAVEQNIESMRQEKLATEDARLDYILALDNGKNPLLSQQIEKQKLMNEWNSIVQPNGDIGYKAGTKEWFQWQTRYENATNALTDAIENLTKEIANTWISDMTNYLQTYNGNYDNAILEKASTMYKNINDMKNANALTESSLTEGYTSILSASGNLDDDKNLITKTISLGNNLKEATVTGYGVAEGSVTNIYNTLTELQKHGVEINPNDYIDTTKGTYASLTGETTLASAKNAGAFDLDVSNGIHGYSSNMNAIQYIRGLSTEKTKTADNDALKYLYNADGITTSLLGTEVTSEGAVSTKLGSMSYDTYKNWIDRNKQTYSNINTRYVPYDSIEYDAKYSANQISGAFYTGDTYTASYGVNYDYKLDDMSLKEGADFVKLAEIIKENKDKLLEVMRKQAEEEEKAYKLMLVNTKVSNNMKEYKDTINNILTNQDENVIDGITNHLESLKSAFTHSATIINANGYSGYEEFQDSIVTPIVNDIFSQMTSISETVGTMFDSGILSVNDELAKTLNNRIDSFAGSFERYQLLMNDIQDDGKLNAEGSLDTYKQFLKDAGVNMSDTDIKNQIADFDANGIAKWVDSLNKLFGGIYEYALNNSETSIKNLNEQAKQLLNTKNAQDSILSSISGFDDFSIANDTAKMFTDALGADALTKLIGLEGNTFDTSSISGMTGLSLGSNADPYEMYYEYEKDRIMKRIQNEQEGSDEWYQAELDLWNLMQANAEHIKQKADEATNAIEDALGRIEETVKTRVAEETKSGKGDAIFMDFGDIRGKSSSVIDQLLEHIDLNTPEGQKLVKRLGQLGLSKKR